MATITNINNRYEIVEKIGSGATGSVFRVHDLMNGRITRALKLINSSGMSPETVTAIRNEFSVLRQCNHPNIVAVHEFGTVHSDKTGKPTDDIYFTLDFVDGNDLLQATEHADDGTIASFIFQIANALDYIHRLGLIHFDIKPENIIVTEIQNNDVIMRIPKIIDFGFAAPGNKPESGSLRGSLNYMAPECIAGDEYDHRADLYSLGVTLYQLLTRSLPFASDDPVELLKKQRTEAVKDISAFRPGTHPILLDLTVSLLEKDPHKRIPTARSVAAKIAPLVHDKPIMENTNIDIHPVGLVGRKEIVRRLTEHLEWEFGKSAAANGAKPKRIVCVVGDQGTGKTPLLDEWRRRAQSEDMLVIGLHCFLETAPPLEPFRWFLHELRFVLLAHGAQARGLIQRYDYLFSALSYDAGEESESPAPLDFSDEERQLEFLRSIQRLIKDSYAIVPFALYIDDVHNADEMTLQFLRLFIRTSNETVPLMVMSCETIYTVTTELNVDVDELDIIPIGGYDEHDIAELLSLYLRTTEIPAEIARSLADIIGDSPHIVREYLGQFRRYSPSEAIAELRKTISLPDPRKMFPRSIDDMYERRIRQLGSAERNVLNAVSCFRVPVSKEILSKIISIPPALLDHILSLLTMMGTLKIFEDGSKVYFSHSSFRNFIYRQPSADRSAMHAVIAEVLEKSAADSHDIDAEQIAYHFKQAGNLTKALLYYRRAAESAAQAHSLQESNTLLESALQCAATDAESETILEQLARQSDLVEEYDKAEMLYTTLLARPNISNNNKYRYLKALGSVQTRCGLIDKAAESFNAASAAAQTPSEYVQIEDELIDIDISRGRLDAARARCMNVLESTASPENNPQTSSVLTKLGIISFYENNYDESTEYFLKAYQIMEAHGDKTMLISPLLNLGNVYSVRLQHKKAMESWNLALRYAEEIGNVHQQGQICNNLGIAEYNRGEYENALHYYRKGIRIFEQSGNAPGRALCLSNIGEVYYLRSEYEKALEVWEQCLELRTKSNDAQVLAETHLHLSKLYLQYNDREKARHHLQQSLGHIDQTRLEAKRPVYYLVRSAVELADKNFVEAEKYYRQALEPLQSVGKGIHYWELMLTGGKIFRGSERHNEAVECFTKALEKGVLLGLPLLQAEALLELGIESRWKNIASPKKPLSYFKEALELLKNEAINDVSWKVCLELGKEYAVRGLTVKSHEYLIKARQSLHYVGSLNTRPILQKMFWDADERSAAARSLEGLTDDRTG